MSSQSVIDVIFCQDCPRETAESKRASRMIADLNISSAMSPYQPKLVPISVLITLNHDCSTSRLADVDVSIPDPSPSPRRSSSQGTSLVVMPSNNINQQTVSLFPSSCSPHKDPLRNVFLTSTQVRNGLSVCFRFSSAGNMMNVPSFKLETDLDAMEQQQQEVVTPPKLEIRLLIPLCDRCSSER
jgi:hypothetical protein